MTLATRLPAFPWDRDTSPGFLRCRHFRYFVFLLAVHRKILETFFLAEEKRSWRTRIFQDL